MNYTFSTKKTIPTFYLYFHQQLPISTTHGIHPRIINTDQPLTWHFAGWQTCYLFFDSRLLFSGRTSKQRHFLFIFVRDFAWFCLLLPNFALFLTLSLNVENFVVGSVFLNRNRYRARERDI